MENTKKETARLKTYYTEKVVPAMLKEHKYSNVNEVPKIEKIVLNMGLGDVKDNSKSLNLAVEELATIAGQKPVITKAKKSVANFKVREGMNIGAKVTLEIVCTSSWIDLSRWHCHVLETLEASIQNHLMVVATSHMASKNNLFSQKLFMTKSRKFVVLT